MTRRSLSMLIVLNVILLAAIALTIGPVDKAQAQFGGGSYVMVAGNSSQSPIQVIYVLKSDGQVVGFTFNTANKKLEPVGKRNIGTDMKAIGGDR